ncbi:MAG: hypothetical protein Q9228_007918, partial [Teloschistes exilis]
QQTASPAVPVQPPQQSYTTSHLNFGGSSSNQYQVPAIPPAPSSIPPPPPPSNGYSQSNNYTYRVPPAPSRQMSTTSNPYGLNQSSTQSQPQYSQPSLYTDGSNDYRPTYDHRRASMPLNTQPTYQQPQRVNSYSQLDTRPQSIPSYYAPPAQQSAPRSMTPHSTGQLLPPLSTIQQSLEKDYEPPTPAVPLPSSSTNGAGNPTYNQTFDNTSMSKYTPYIPTPHTAIPTPMPIETSRNGKRSYGSVFDTSDQTRSLHDRMRPEAVGMALPQVEAEDGTLHDYDIDGIGKMLSYRRADGTRQVKKCPSPVSD